MSETTQSSALYQVFAAPSQITRNSIVAARGALTRGARLMASAKRPTQVVGKAGLRLNQVAHDSVEQLLKHQVHVLEGLMDESAQRLQVAAEAGTLRSLVNEQVAMLPESRARLVKDLRVALDILLDTRKDLTSVVREELLALREQLGNSPTKAEEAVEAAKEAVEGTVARVADAAERVTATTA
jgi:phasin family protein